MDKAESDLRKTKIFQQYLIKLSQIYPDLIILNPLNNLYRVPTFVIQIKNYHFNYIVALLSDLYRIETRGGIQCSSLYAKKLLHINRKSEEYLKDIITSNQGYPAGYGFVRISLNSFISDKDMIYIIQSLEKIITKDAEFYKNRSKFIPEKNIFIKN